MLRLAIKSRRLHSPVRNPTALLLLVALTLPIPLAAVAADYERAREEMVRTQLRGRDIIDSATLKAMGKVPRHLFVTQRLSGRAYEDGPLPIGYGQTISQPYIVAFMTQMVRPLPGQRVLEIGTGSGYQAAVLAETGVEVYTVEIIPELAKEAGERLARLGYRDVRIREGDGYHGWEEHGPYDAILVTAAAEYIPPPLLRQLADGGRMIIPVGHPFFVQTLMLIDKRGEEVTTRSLMPVRFVPFRRAR